MKKLIIINEIKGIAFLLMLIHHIFYFYDVSNDYKTKLSDNKIVDVCGTISRHLFIILVGINIYLQYSNNNDIIKNIFNKSTFKLFLSCLIVSLSTYIIYPKYWIRFGVLHFIFFGSIIGKLFVGNTNLCLIASILIFMFSDNLELLNINKITNLMLGSGINNYYMMDYFPIIKWIPFVLLGIWSGKNIVNNFKDFNDKTILSYFGKNSLDLYLIHFLILLIIY